ncbi:MAG: hypothetical protein ABSG31_16895 [Tepidisphaeraceae bacterium]|jgi:hypothetical protein
MAVTEQEFIESIDCRFPYHDEEKWKMVIQTAISLSPNCAFMVLHELCRPPRSSTVNPQERKKIFDYWCCQFSHPIVPIVSKAAIALIEGGDHSVAEASDAMIAVADYPGEYCALSILYFSCDDVGGKVDELYRGIIQRWGMKTSVP